LIETDAIHPALMEVVGIAVSLATFTFINHLTVGIVIWFARGENFAKSGVLNYFPLALDFTTLSLGAVAAIMWRFNPFADLLVLLPGYLIYTTLQVPALQRKTEVDPKTGLFNSAYFNQALKSELDRAIRFNRPLTVVMADLDLLRNINNTYGHVAGDEVLIEITKILQKHMRQYDVLARVGGEEFAIIILEATPEEIFPRIEVLRESIAQNNFRISTSTTPIRATMSFGIATRQEHDQEPQQILHNADIALYSSKLKGRNRVTIYSEDSLHEWLKKASHESDSRESSYQANVPPEAPVASPAPQEPSHPDPKTSDRRAAPIYTDSNSRSFHYPNWIINAYIALLAAITIVLFVANSRSTSQIDWFSLAVFSAMVFFTEWMSIDLYVKDSSISTSAVPLIAGFLLLGPPGILVLSLVMSITTSIKHRSPMNPLIFNFCNQAIAGLLCWTVFRWANGSQFVSPLITELIACILTGMAVYLVTTWNVALAIHFSMNTSLYPIWRDKFGWLAPYYLTMGVIAFGILFGYNQLGITGLLIVVLPLLLLRISQEQYIHRTKAAVSELHQKNLELQHHSDEINRLNTGLIDALSQVIDLRDPGTRRHSRQVSKLSILIAKKLGLHHNLVDDILKASLLHDLGKLGIPDTILLKSGRLNSTEYEIIQGHAKLGAVLLKSNNILQELSTIVRNHHEHFDGGGYPDQLSGDDIPIAARIIAVADAFDAMASDRPYRPGMSEAEIVQEFTRCSGTQFDPDIVKALLEILYEDHAIFDDYQGQPVDFSHLKSNLLWVLLDDN
jgi:diguanylate cyclase (GGDEF)-like protein/putative nucleotidyltransferase with HDIG domain